MDYDNYKKRFDTAHSLLDEVKIMQSNAKESIARDYNLWDKDPAHKSFRQQVTELLRRTVSMIRTTPQTEGLFNDLELLLKKMDPDSPGILGQSPEPRDLQTMQDALTRYLDHLEFLS